MYQVRDFVHLGFDQNRGAQRRCQIQLKKLNYAPFKHYTKVFTVKTFHARHPTESDKIAGRKAERKMERPLSMQMCGK